MKVPARCGTLSGHNAHRKRGEPDCPACRQAEREYQHNYKLKRRRRGIPDPITMPHFDGAPCAADPEAWFSDNRDTQATAKAWCQSCDYLQPCRDYAMAYAVQGVWGGLDEGQRRRLQREQGITPLSVILGRGA